MSEFSFVHANGSSDFKAADRTRRAFEQMLGLHAEKLGVILRRDDMAHTTQHGDVLRIWFKSSSSYICTRYLIYASGRYGIYVIPRNRILIDRLVACATSVQHIASVWRPAVRIDALENGWGYSIQTSPKERSIVLFTAAAAPVDVIPVVALMRMPV